jgi:hypothetical protein
MRWRFKRDASKVDGPIIGVVVARKAEKARCDFRF